MKEKPERKMLLPLIVTLAGIALLLWLARSWRSTLHPHYPQVEAPKTRMLGVNFDPACCDDVDGEMKRIAEAGFDTVRVMFPWDAIEPQRGEFRWSKWDRVVRAASGQGLNVIAVLYTSPSWARASADAGDRFAPPADWRDFAPFARKFAERYGSTIDLYQIWNEPNIAPNWGHREVSAESYVRLLREAYIAIHSVDPKATVLTAALAPNVEPGGLNESDVKYLDEVYRADGAQWFDAVAAQAYGFDLPPTAPPSPSKLNFRRVELLRAVMVAHGDAATPVFVTSFGWNTRKSIWKSVPPESQRAFAKESVDFAFENWPWAHGMIWARWRPSAPPNDPAWGFALMTPDGSATPAMEGLKEAMQERPYLGAGVHKADSPSIGYEGDWRVSDFGADPDKAGGKMTIPFRGKGIALRVRRGNYRAYLTVEVDGKPAPDLPKDRKGNAYVQLYDPLHGEATVLLASGLPRDSHEAVVEAHRGWGQWPVESVIVLTNDVRRWGIVQPILFLTALALAMAGMWRLGRILAADTEFLAAPTVVWGLAVVAFLMPLSNGHTLWYELALWALAGWMLFVEHLHGRKRLFRSMVPTDAPIAALLVVALASTLAADRFGVANREFRIVFVDGALIYFLASRAGNVRPAMWGWLLGSAFVASWGLWQAATGHGVITAEGVFRVRGPYGSPNNLALYLERGLMLMLTMLILGEKEIVRIAAAVLVIVTAAATLLTFSRGALLVGIPAGIATIALASAALPKSSRKKVWIGIGAAIVLGAIALIPFLGTERFRSLRSPESGTALFRLDLWWSSVKMFLDSPWFGVGPDNFLYRYRSFYMLPGAWRDPNLSHPHNFLLDFATRLGIGGLLAGAWLAWETLEPIVRQLKEALSEEPYLVIGILAGWSATFAHGLIDNSIFLPDLMAVFMLSIGIVVSSRVVK